MNDLKELITSLEDIEMSITNEEETAADIRKSIAVLCPVKIGTTVEVSGFSYHGKQLVVDQIRWTNDAWKYVDDIYTDGYGWVLYGYVLNKSSQIGTNRGEAFVLYAED